MCEFVYYLTVVSVERQIFFGAIEKIKVMGIEGEMEIFPGHTPLLTLIKPGILYIYTESNHVDFIYLSGGILEVQNNSAIILADTVIRAEELDEKRIQESKIQIEGCLRRLSYNDKEYMITSLEMSKAIAKLRLLELIKGNNYL